MILVILVLDILVINKTKTDSTFPLNQFAIQGYSKPYRFDRKRNGGGVFMYLREDSPIRELKIHNTPEGIEISTGIGDFNGYSYSRGYW